MSVELRPTTRVAFLIALEAALFRAGFRPGRWSVPYAMLGGLMGAALRPARDRPCGTLERWAPAVVLLGLATACVVVAFVRDDPPVTSPAPALVVV